MKRDPVYLNRTQRQRAVEEFVRSFKKWGIELRIISIDRVHVHWLARFRAHDPRHYVGLAKKESSAYLKQHGLAPSGGLWAVRCKCLPIADRTHFDNVVDYIDNHEAKGAAIWEWDHEEWGNFNPTNLLLD